MILGTEATEHLMKKQPHTTTAAFGDAPRLEPWLCSDGKPLLTVSHRGEVRL